MANDGSHGWHPRLLLLSPTDVNVYGNGEESPRWLGFEKSGCDGLYKRRSVAYWTAGYDASDVARIRGSGHGRMTELARAGVPQEAAMHVKVKRG